MHKYKLRRLLAGISGGLLAFILLTEGMEPFLQIPYAFAQVKGSSELEVFLGEGAGMLITFLTVIAWIVFYFMHFLLDPEFIFDMTSTGDSSLVNMLNEIWRLSRDLMNVVFAFMLVFAAIYAIVKEDKSALTSNGKKFILAVILVNFSWFIPRVVYDIANVTTSAIYGIPSLISTPCQVRTRTGIQPCIIITDVQFPLGDKDEINNIVAAGGYDCISDLVCFRKAPMGSRNISSLSTVLNGLVINHGRLSTLARVSCTPRNNDILDHIAFLMQSGIVLLIHAALIFPLLAMMVAFLIRIPVLWITMAFMPFAFLGYVAGDKLPNLGKLNPKSIWDLFLKAAFMPAILALPLTIGYLMLNALSGVTNAQMQDARICITEDINDLWALLWMLASLGIMYFGVFEVLQNMGQLGGGTITQSIKGAGNQLGRLGLKAPLMAPIIPGPAGGQGVSPLGAFKQLQSKLALAESRGSFQGITSSTGRNQQGNQQPGGSPPEVLQATERQRVVQALKDANIKNEFKKVVQAGDINKIRQMLETNSGLNPNSLQNHQIADALKQIQQQIAPKEHADYGLTDSNIAAITAKIRTGGI